jgi:hypothetical protein
VYYVRRWLAYVAARTRISARATVGASRAFPALGALQRGRSAERKPQKDIKRRLERSPDDEDALALAHRTQRTVGIILL